MKRRTVLVALISSVFAACRRLDTKQETAAPLPPDDSAETEECLPQELSISLDEYPQLTEVDASALVSFPDQFVHLLVVCIEQQKWIAVWKICTHGACDVEWDEQLLAVKCPCHNSLFDLDGEVIQGPAQRPLKSYSVCRSGNTLFLSLA